MAANHAIQDLNAILTVCGIVDQAKRTHIIDGKHFQSLQDFCMFESNKDVDRMLSCLASRTQQEGCMHLRTIAIKKLQAFVFWSKDHQMHGLNLVAAEFNQAAMLKVMEGKHVQKEVKETELAPVVKDIGKFDPYRFKTCQDAFLNILSQLIGVWGILLHYVVCNDMPPDKFENDAEECMYHIQLNGNAYMEDNKKHRLNIGVTGYANIRFHLSIMALRTKVDVVEDTLADVVMGEVAEADDMAAEVVVAAADLVDETTTTTLMVLTFLIPIAALVLTSGTNLYVKDAIECSMNTTDQPDVTELMTGIMRVHYCRVTVMTMRMTPAKMAMTIIILIAVVTMDAGSDAEHMGTTPLLLDC